MLKLLCFALTVINITCVCGMESDSDTEIISEVDEGRMPESYFTGAIDQIVDQPRAHKPKTIFTISNSERTIINAVIERSENDVQAISNMFQHVIDLIAKNSSKSTRQITMKLLKKYEFKIKKKNGTEYNDSTKKQYVSAMVKIAKDNNKCEIFSKLLEKNLGIHDKNPSLLTQNTFTKKRTLAVDSEEIIGRKRKRAEHPSDGDYEDNEKVVLKKMKINKLGDVITSCDTSADNTCALDLLVQVALNEIKQPINTEKKYPDMSAVNRSSNVMRPVTAHTKNSKLKRKIQRSPKKVSPSKKIGRRFAVRRRGARASSYYPTARRNLFAGNPSLRQNTSNVRVNRMQGSRLNSWHRYKMFNDIRRNLNKEIESGEYSENVKRRIRYSRSSGNASRQSDQPTIISESKTLIFTKTGLKPLNE